MNLGAISCTWWKMGRLSTSASIGSGKRNLLADLYPKTGSGEIQANWFAAALLMPGELVRIEWDKHLSMAKMFNVSEEAMGYKLDTLNLWDPPSGR